MQKIDEDRPLTDLDSDEYGFAPIAEKLATSITGLADSEGMVFGIEGAWGSGKTSFLNFLHSSLAASGGVHVLTLAPWLIGDSRSLVAALVEGMAPVLEQAEESTGKDTQQNKLMKIAKSADLVRAYAARTGRGIAPLAKLAGMVVPGASLVGDALDLGAKALDGLSWTQSDEAIKAEISKRIRESGAKFVVLIDDLDRLEPAQAVEVMRLIRSVADFPRVAYVLCYDREILAHALEVGLSVKDGDLYLQKIVQLTFALPLPEPFDLRNALRHKCLEFFKKVNGREPSDEEKGDIFQAIDREGNDLRTPRDVKLVLNGLVFIYPAIAEEVYFPDLCRIHLLKALKPKLHRWVEIYLGLRAAVVSGDAIVHKPERARLGDQLLELLPDDDRAASSSIWSLRRFIPGVAKADAPENRVFQQTTQREIADLIAKRRVGSPLHYRFYFALSAPKAMIPPKRMDEIRRAAGRSLEELQGVLVSFIEDERPLGKSWYEHLLTRLDDDVLNAYGFDELFGLILGFATTYDLAQRKLEGRRASMVSLGLQIQQLVSLALRKMRLLDPTRMPLALERIYSEGSLSWLVGHFHRQELFGHGLVGDQKQPEFLWVLTTDELHMGGAILVERIDRSATTLSTLADFSSFIWGWRDLSGLEAVRKWVADYASDDHAFLSILMELRSWAISDKVYYPLARSSVEMFFEYGEVLKRLDTIYAGGDPDMVSTVEDLKKSLKQGERD